MKWFWRIVEAVVWLITAALVGLTVYSAWQISLLICN